MDRARILLLTALCIVALAGCGRHDNNSTDDLAQQRKDVMGSPAPASERAKIDAMRAKQAQDMAAAQAAAQANAGKTPGKP
ncbi:hypothetical protein CCAX7_21260 [Capsulimonas corticalis]|uniref:Uncharacterized protein n=1 Tax=Capsulimonas corticalis TaxID=2219043 RepID=A0A402D202_9BACT|nr:hypothetical protein [Capsulimonas corticalis]BDI30075.1 hypothetical protein CCAX7_21260 [Capsulimonas corticalis]